MSGFPQEDDNGSCEYYTPRFIFEALGLVFDLDPCHPFPRLPWTPVYEVYSLPEDGLALPWWGLVWLNPPYGRKHTHAWLQKLAAHGSGIALVNARTDTAWFHEATATATAVCFLKGRVRFVDRFEKPFQTLNKKTGEMEDGSPKVGSVLIAWGEEAAQALERCGLGVTLRQSEGG